MGIILIEKDSDSSESEDTVTISIQEAVDKLEDLEKKLEQPVETTATPDNGFTDLDDEGPVDGLEDEPELPPKDPDEGPEQAPDDIPEGPDVPRKTKKPTPSKGWLSGSFSQKETIGIVVLFLIGIVAAAFILAVPPEDRMRMDGEFDDWDDANRVSDDTMDVDKAGIDIVSTAIKSENSHLYFLIEVRGTIFPSGEGGQMAHIFIDSNGNQDGYSIMGIYADYMVEVYGENGKVRSSSYFKFMPMDNSSRSQMNWNNWTYLGGVEAAAEGDMLEVGMPYHNGDDAKVLFHMSDTEGNQDTSWILPIKSGADHVPIMVESGPTLPVGSNLTEGEHTLLEITLESVRGSSTVESISIAHKGNALDEDIGTLTLVSAGTPIAFSSIVNGTATFDLNKFEFMDRTTLYVDVEVMASGSERVLDLALDKVRSSAATTTYDVENGAWYLIGPSQYYRIDGLFAEWNDTGLDPVGDAPADIDIDGYKAARTDFSTYFYLSVDGEMAAGTQVPLRSPVVVPGAVGSQDQRPLPVMTGEDAVYIFLEVQPAVFGYHPAGFPVTANRMVRIAGIDGEVTTTEYFSFAGTDPLDWAWDEIHTPVNAAVNGDSMESSLNMDLQEFQAYFHIVDWRNGSGDFSEDVVTISKLAGIDDPFAITIDGAAYQSLTGENWTSLNSPGSGQTFVSTAAGSGTTAGYLYVLRSDGAVFVTRNAVDGWYRYGYGAPGLPASDTFVDIAVGSGTTVGYVYILRADGTVYVTRNAVDGWYEYGYNSPDLPDSDGYVGIAAGSGTTAGYVYVLRNDGATFFTSNGVGGWGQYGYGSPTIPSSTAYVDIAAGTGNTAGYIYVLENDGDVYVARNGVEGWYQWGYGEPDIDPSSAYVEIDVNDNGDAYVLRNDGNVYFSDSAVQGWYRYGYGSPALTSSSGYVGVAAGSGNTIGYTYLLNNDGTAYVTRNAVDGWYEYGYGSPYLLTVSSFVDIASDTGAVFTLRNNGSVYRSDNGSAWSHLADAGTDTSWTSIASGEIAHIFTMRNDGTVVRIHNTTGSITSWGDCGSDTSWVSLASDGTYLYALRADGTTAYSSVSTASWSSKGDAGTGGSWVSIGTLSGETYVYAMRNDRSVYRSLTGTSTTWTSWAPAGSDTSWVSIAVSPNYVFALRSDGRVDRATQAPSPVWNTSFGNLGDDGAVALDTIVSELAFMLLPIFMLVAVTHFNRRRRNKSNSRSNRGDGR